MSQKELTRHYVLQQCIDGKLTVSQAAERLKLSARRIKQLKKEFRAIGAAAVIHGNAKRPSPKRIPQELVQQILDLRKHELLASSNFTHFQEILAIHYDIHVSYSTLYRLLKKEGFESPKKRRRKRKLHPTRPRKPSIGMMLQADATPYEWFSGEIKYSLHAFIDDATSKITGLYLCKNECLLGYLEVLRQTLTQYGIPQSLYPDRYGVFFVNPKKEQERSIEEQLAGTEKKLTQFGKIVEELGIEMFPAQSPQAKGRIERLWDTLQSRLPVEFKLHGVSTLEEANRFLRDYRKRFNEQFSCEPEEEYSSFVPVPSTIDLDRLLCARMERSLSAGSTITIQGKKFQIEQTIFPARTKVTLLLSEKYGLQALINGAFYPIRLLSSTQRAYSGSLRTGEMSHVLTGLLDHFLRKDAKHSA